MWWLITACTPEPPIVVASSGPHTTSLEVQTAEGVRWTLDGDDRGVVVSPLDLTDAGHGAHTLTFVQPGLFADSAPTQLDIELDQRGPVATAYGASSVEQGHTLALKLTYDEPPVRRTLSFLDRERTLYPFENGERVLIGVPIRTEAGSHALILETEDAHGNVLRQTLAIDVVAVDWPFTGKLPLSKKKASVPSEAVQRMRSERDPVYAEERPEALWMGPMTMPVEGRHTSAFGTYREYPDGRRSHHDAEDISRKPWTPIHAAHDGHIALARSQAVHGNAVLLAHGQGVVSLYSHMAALDVEEGQQIQQGDRIGWLGSTGRSTGPHLHFGVVVDEVPVDPMQWIDEGFDRFPAAGHPFRAR